MNRHEAEDTRNNLTLLNLAKKVDNTEALDVYRAILKLFSKEKYFKIENDCAKMVVGFVVDRVSALRPGRTKMISTKIRCKKEVFQEAMAMLSVQEHYTIIKNERTPVFDDNLNYTIIIDLKE